jgi:NADH-quinone oxidoreductase subunit G
MAEALAAGDGAVLLGSYALSHPQAAALRSLAALIGELSGAKVGQLPAANSAGGWLAGCVPHRGPAGTAGAVTGRGAQQMLRDPLKGYLLFGLEPELDCLDGAQALRALGQAEFTAMFTSFKPSPHTSRASDYAHAWLPLAPFTESEGTFVNVEGRHQAFGQTAEGLGQARPGWKILRVLANRLGLAGFEQDTIADVRAELRTDGVAAGALKPATYEIAAVSPATSGQLIRIAEVPIYAVDALTRRAPALQATADNPRPAARINPADAARLGFHGGETVRAQMAGGEARLGIGLDERVPTGCVLIASGYPETAALGGHGPVTLARI